jgi:hypothetical protein
VLITDISDVEILNSPFKYFERNKVYLGVNETWKDMPQLREKYPLLANSYYDNVPRYNPGTIGGHYKAVHTFVNKLSYQLLSCSKKGLFNQNLGMATVIADAMNKNVVCGKPFVTTFKKYEYDPQCYVRHK